ncbi:prepilin peptidase [Micromonospora sonneratiae]|uniref:Prepilin peptidase n=1 Tax=Micromonospora sonneratiae TaxID=1184706 RepID=A0ABW3YS65_9ACTN
MALATPGTTVNPRWPVRVIAALAVTPLLRRLVIADSVPSGCPRRTHCVRCGLPVSLTTPLRAVSPIGRCAGCNSRIGAPPMLLELALLAAVAVLASWFRSGPEASPANLPVVLETAAIGWWAVCAVPLAFVDLAVHRLPDRLTYAAVIGTWTLFGLAAIVDGDGTGWLRAVSAGIVIALLFAATTLLLGRRGFGLGDAKLALSSAAILGWSGWGAVVLGLTAAFTTSAVGALILLTARRVRWSDHLPFGPFLILGTLVAVAVVGR